eukprot:4390928-Amphidinium_carterae.1
MTRIEQQCSARVKHNGCIIILSKPVTQAHTRANQHLTGETVLQLGAAPAEAPHPHHLGREGWAKQGCG